MARETNGGAFAAAKPTGSMRCGHTRLGPLSFPSLSPPAPQQPLAVDLCAHSASYMELTGWIGLSNPHASGGQIRYGRRFTGSASFFRIKPQTTQVIIVAELSFSHRVGGREPLLLPST